MRRPGAAVIAEPLRIVLVLANLMDREGNLNDESVARLEAAARLFFETGADRLMVIGWDYRPDCSIAICDAMASHLLSTTRIDDKAIIRNRASRDTVGDAIFSRIQLEKTFSDFQLSVVSTDYHIPRVTEVFSRVYGQARKLEFFGSDDHPIISRDSSENDSLCAFRQTFEGIPSGDLLGFRDRMLSAHPFYNGTSFPDRPIPDGALTLKGVSLT